MKKKLRDEDARAVDLLLNLPTIARGGKLMAAPVSRARLNAAREVLEILSLLPAEEPAADLVERTLGRIDAVVPRTVQVPRASSQVRAIH